MRSEREERMDEMDGMDYGRYGRPSFILHPSFPTPAVQLNTRLSADPQRIRPSSSAARTVRSKAFFETWNSFGSMRNNRPPGADEGGEFFGSPSCRRVLRE